MKDLIIKNIENTVIFYETALNKGKIWREPVVRIVSAIDDRFESLKKIVTEDHLLPQDVLSGAESIISFFLPFSEDIISSNIKGKYASSEWAQAYIDTNNLISIINNSIEKLLDGYGYKTGKIPATHNFDTEKLISRWSHRHIAYIAGTGTFGINNMIITDKGCCGRLGSIVTTVRVSGAAGNKITAEKCLYKINGSCGICRKKCPAGAYQDDFFNRFKCNDMCQENAELHKRDGFADVCGKCLAGLPCSSKDPSIATDL